MKVKVYKKSFWVLEIDHKNGLDKICLIQNNRKEAVSEKKALEKNEKELLGLSKQ